MSSPPPVSSPPVATGSSGSSGRSSGSSGRSTGSSGRSSGSSRRLRELSWFERRLLAEAALALALSRVAVRRFPFQSSARVLRLSQGRGVPEGPVLQSPVSGAGSPVSGAGSPESGAGSAESGAGSPESRAGSPVSAAESSAAADADRAETIGWAVRAVAARLPWESTCLMQALAAAALLRRRRIPLTLTLGVAKDGSEMEAHAWVVCGEQVLVGGGGHERFTPLASYG